MLNSYRSIVKTAETRFLVGNVRMASDKIEDLASKYAGYVTYSNLRNQESDYSRIEISRDSLVISRKIVVENNMVKSVEITVTGSLPDLYIVQSGITAKDKVLLEGVQKVKENDKIKFEDQKPEEVINHLRLKAE